MTRARWIRPLVPTWPRLTTAMLPSAGKAKEGQIRLPKRALSITFDDGYADNYNVAAPILLRLGLAATFFVATGFLDGGCMFNDVVIEALRCAGGAELDLDDLGLGRHPLGDPDRKSTRLNSSHEWIS